MFAVGPTLFSSAAITGDHYPGDGLTRLQVAFAGASSADVSSYLVGSGVNDEFTVTDGAASALFDSNANPKTLTYSNASMAQLNNTSPMTFEIFWMATLDTPSPQNPGNTVKFAQFTTRTNGVDFYISAYPNDRNIYIYNPGFTATTVTLAHQYGVRNHLALVHRAAGTLDVYINGTRQVTAAVDPAAVVPTGTLQLGGVGRGDTRITYYGARVRAAEMYFGTTCSVPSTPVDWGPP